MVEHCFIDYKKGVMLIGQSVAISSEDEIEEMDCLHALLRLLYLYNVKHALELHTNDIEKIECYHDDVKEAKMPAELSHIIEDLIEDVGRKVGKCISKIK